MDGNNKDQSRNKWNTGVKSSRQRSMKEERVFWKETKLINFSHTHQEETGAKEIKNEKGEVTTHTLEAQRIITDLDEQLNKCHQIG